MFRHHGPGCPAGPGTAGIRIWTAFLGEPIHVLRLQDAAEGTPKSMKHIHLCCPLSLPNVAPMQARPERKEVAPPPSGVPVGPTHTLSPKGPGTY
jgi:hypothetical protein